MKTTFTKHSCKRLLALLAFALTAFTAPATAQKYNAGDIAVINSIINTNGLKWTPANPADGSVVPEGWTGVTWSADATNKRITKLNVYSKGLTGALDVSDLTALVRLICESNQLTSLDVSNLTAFERLDCKINKLLP